jgi:Nucleotide modification associated domain 3
MHKPSRAGEGDLGMSQTGRSRLVLSRKGFDSDFGGRPSPILPDGQMVSLPIPDRGSDLRYADCRTADGVGYLELLQRLGIETIRYSNGPTVTKVPISGTLGAQLDPDLSRWTLPRLAGWRPLFGQVDRAQSHLRNQGVGPGDLFLFFGLFSPTTQLPNGRLSYASQRDWMHVLWGWLEVNRVVPVTDELLTELPWAAGHPHWRARHLDRYRRHNTLYVAREHSTLLPGLPGGGVFPEFRPLLRLSRPGSTRSVWRLPMALHPDRTQLPLTGQSPGAWSIEADSAVLRSAGRGQEFVVEMHDGTRDWIRGVLTAGAQKTQEPAGGGPLTRGGR